MNKLVELKDARVVSDLNLVCPITEVEPRAEYHPKNLEGDLTQVVLPLCLSSVKSVLLVWRLIFFLFFSFESGIMAGHGERTHMRERMRATYSGNHMSWDSNLEWNQSLVTLSLLE